ncbi:alanine--glyoxylate aminotransferase family protein [soil metagenome]
MNQLLMTPGPVPVPPEVLNALALPIEHHRTPAFQKCLERVLAKLPALFGTKQRAFMHVSTGSGGMESLLVNVLSPGENVAAVVSGKFGERWADMAEAYGAHVDRFEVTWGEAVNIEKFEKWLVALSHKPHIVMSQACETSTAVLHPIEQMAKVIRKANSEALFLVDAITALGAMPLPMDDWDLDGVVGGSQKAFMLPTGLSFVAWSERAWKKIPLAKTPRFYFDIRAELEANKRGETNFSSAVPLVKALDVVLTQIDSFGGSRALYERIDVLASATRNAATAMGFDLLAATPSPSLTAIRVPDGIDGAKWRTLLESKYELVLMGGQDSLKGKIIRLGHMGYISDSDLLRALKSIADSANDLKPETVSAAKLNSALDIARTKLKSVPMPWPTR